MPGGLVVWPASGYTPGCLDLPGHQRLCSLKLAAELGLSLFSWGQRGGTAEAY